MGVSKFTYGRQLPRLTIVMVGSNRPTSPRRSSRGKRGDEPAKSVPFLSHARPQILRRRRLLPGGADAEEISQKLSSAGRDRNRRRDRRCRDNGDRRSYPFGEHAVAAAVTASG